MSRKLSVLGSGLNVSVTCLGWAAGFLDGEGCIRVAKRNPGNDANPIYSLEVTITQNCLTTLVHFQDVVGDLAKDGHANSLSIIRARSLSAIAGCWRSTSASAFQHRRQWSKRHARGLDGCNGSGGLLFAAARELD